jgi:sugar transferase (PEP-CTERM/EpsH1 system associated)
MRRREYRQCVKTPTPHLRAPVRQTTIKAFYSFIPQRERARVDRSRYRSVTYMDILYLSHCVPNPPDKGEKIRSYRQLKYLCSRFRVHLVCFGRNEAERPFVQELSGQCASVHMEVLSTPSALARAAFEYAMGRSLSVAFFNSPSMRKYVEALAGRVRLSAAVVYTAVMMQFAPLNVPLLLDLVDVDSEKWLEYSRTRWPGFLYALEGRRFRRHEIDQSKRARRVLLSTAAEVELFRSFAGSVSAECLSNGVDVDYFDPSRSQVLPELNGRRLLAFIGTMDYYPNIEAAIWFATEVFPQLRAHDSRSEFFVVGRNPSKAVLRLAQEPGITVTGSVADVRPYIAASLAVVAPLRIARGIQNKVLEALSMGKTVLASDPICRTFGPVLPCGLVRCSSPTGFIDAAMAIGQPAGLPDPSIRAQAQRQFPWSRALAVLSREIDSLLERPR